MTDPYNSYKTHAQAVRVVSLPVQKPDPIARLDVSDEWKRRFRAIAKAGGPKLPRLRELSGPERRGINFNVAASLLGPIYYLAKGLWRQAVIYLLMAVVGVFLMEALGFGKLGRAIGYGFAAIYAVRANVSYYQMRVLGKAPWV